MSRVRRFVRTSVLGGLVVLLPVGVLLIVFNWVYGSLRDLLKPVTDQVARQIRESLPTSIYSWAVDFAAFLIVLSVMVAICFLTGVLLKTALGRWFHNRIEEYVLKLAPGYNLVKETVLQFFGDKPSPFKTVAFVRIFGNDTPTMVTAFVTERHSNGWFTVFVPTGPNPTSGQIFHVPGECVAILDEKVEDVMRSVISCGAGSDKLMFSYDRRSAPAAASD
ncbi:MAG: DUF502 domain-containing protein [Planctomycetota bacterium]